MLDFVVSNNLALRVADSLFYRWLIQHCNASVITISTSTLNRDLDKTFLSAQNALKAKIHEHVKDGGRISIIKDAWTASNSMEFIAVTRYWINSK